MKPTKRQRIIDVSLAQLETFASRLGTWDQESGLHYILRVPIADRTVGGGIGLVQDTESKKWTVVGGPAWVGTLMESEVPAHIRMAMGSIEGRFAGLAIALNVLDGGQINPKDRSRCDDVLDRHGH